MVGVWKAEDAYWLMGIAFDKSRFTSQFQMEQAPESRQDRLDRISRMSRQPTETKIDETGLRYKAKIGGSPFGAPSHANSSMSCYKCGKHKPRGLGSFKCLLNQSMFFCAECRPTKDATQS